MHLFCVWSIEIMRFFPHLLLVHLFAFEWNLNEYVYVMGKLIVWFTFYLLGDLCRFFFTFCFRIGESLLYGVTRRHMNKFAMYFRTNWIYSNDASCSYCGSYGKIREKWNEFVCCFTRKLSDGHSEVIAFVLSVKIA